MPEEARDATRGQDARKDARNDARNDARSQPAILSGPQPVGRSLTFRLVPDIDPRPALARLRDDFGLENGVVGLGASLVRALGRQVEGLRPFPALAGPGVSAPSTQQALWIYVRGPGRTATFDATERAQASLAGALVLDDALDTFVYRDNRDLSGYLDGTENPQGEAAVAAAVVSGVPGLGGSSFVAVQRWTHDLASLRGLSRERRDSIVGRRMDDNEELESAPASAHVKRTAQESFSPPAFMVRRSMPWATAHAQGLEFVAFVESVDRFERQLVRMMGLEDGVIDGLFSFSRPTTGGYYWCPPVAGGRLDLSLLAI
jgi:putative iron-dependent peroxidase